MVCISSEAIEWDFLANIQERVESILKNRLEEWMRTFVGFQWTVEMNWCPNRMPHYEGEKFQSQAIQAVINLWKAIQSKTTIEAFLEETIAVWQNLFRHKAGEFTQLFSKRDFFSGKSKKEIVEFAGSLNAKCMIDLYKDFIYPIIRFYLKQNNEHIKINIKGAQYSLKDINITWCMPAMFILEYDNDPGINHEYIMEQGRKGKALNFLYLEFFVAQQLDSHWIIKAREKRCKYPMKMRLWSVIRLKDGQVFKPGEIFISTPDQFFQTYHVRPFLNSLYTGYLNEADKMRLGGLTWDIIDEITSQFFILYNDPSYKALRKKIFYATILKSILEFYRKEKRPLPQDAKVIAPPPTSTPSQISINTPSQQASPRILPGTVALTPEGMDPTNILVGMIKSQGQIDINSTAQLLNLNPDKVKLLIFNLVGAGKIMGRFRDSLFLVDSGADAQVQKLDNQSSNSITGSGEKFESPKSIIADRVPTFETELAESIEAEVAHPTLTDIKEIGEKELEKLNNLGITKIEDLIQENAQEIANIIGIDKPRVQNWIDKATELKEISSKKIISDKLKLICPLCQKWFEVEKFGEFPCPTCNQVLKIAIHCDRCNSWFSVSKPGKYNCPNCKAAIDASNY